MSECTVYEREAQCCAACRVRIAGCLFSGIPVPGMVHPEPRGCGCNHETQASNPNPGVPVRQREM